VADDCDTNPAGLVEQLTGLTSLGLNSTNGSHVEGMFSAAANNPRLKDFTACDGEMGAPDSALFKHLLTSCPSLTDLDLNHLRINQGALEVLLTHGTSITSMKAFTFQTDVSFAERSCSWKSLGVAGIEHHASVLHWAHLPLKGLKDLEIWDGAHGGGLGTFQLPFDSMPVDQLPRKLHQATTNLAACPAWRAAPDSCIHLAGDPNGPFEDIHSFTPQQRIQLLEALAPVGGPHVKEVTISMRGATFLWDDPEVQALGRSLYSPHLSTLGLAHCTLLVGFWAALGNALPSLTTLKLYGTATCSASDIAVFCSKRRPGHQFSLVLSKKLYQAVSGAELQASLAGQGMAHVEIKQLA
jgi:hypothetical protein